MSACPIFTVPSACVCVCLSVMLLTFEKNLDMSQLNQRTDLELIPRLWTCDLRYIISVFLFF